MPRRARDSTTEAPIEAAVGVVDRVSRAVLAAAVPPSEQQRTYARQIAAFASPKGTLDCVAAFGRTDFRADLKKVTVPTLVIHGDADAIVPFDVSGRRSHDALADSVLVVVEGAPHGFNVTHAGRFNDELIAFLAG